MHRSASSAAAITDECLLLGRLMSASGLSFEVRALRGEKPRTPNWYEGPTNRPGARKST